MGCWNATCALTHLPIKVGEPVVMLMLATLDTVPGQCHYYNEDATLFALPVEGKYNDYGGLEEIQISDETRAMLQHVDFYMHDRGEYVKKSLDMSEIFENLFENNLYIKYPMVGGLSVRYDYTLISYIMYHKDAFELVRDDVMARSTANGKGLYGDALKEKLQRNWDKNKFARQRNQKHLENAIKQAEANPSSDAEELVAILRVAEPFSPVWDGLAWGYKFSNAYEEILWNSETLSEERYISDLVGLASFCTGLDLMRKSFFGISGLGSQSNERLLHKKVAKWTLKHIEESMDEDETESSLGENLYMWN